MPNARRPSRLVLAAAASLCGARVSPAAPADAQAVPVDVELGYRFVDVSGNDQEYRTQINDRPGRPAAVPRLHGRPRCSAAASSTRCTSTARTSARGPPGSFVSLAGQNDVFKLSFTWRETDLYSALPGLREPLHRRRHRPGPADLEPHAQHLRRRARAAARQDRHAAARLHAQHRTTARGRRPTTSARTSSSSTSRSTRSTSSTASGSASTTATSRPGSRRAGASTAGSRSRRLTPGAGDGNVTTPILGQTDVRPSTIVRHQNDKVNTPVTNAWITGTLFGRLKLIGTYIKADGSDETDYAEADAGKFVSFEIARFFSGLAETVDSQARTDFWRASARAEINLASNVDLTGGWVENSRVLDGQALISDALPGHDHLRGPERRRPAAARSTPAPRSTT